MNHNLATTLFNTIKFVEDATGMEALLHDDAWEYSLRDAVLRVTFRSTRKQIAETKRESVNILKDQGWDVSWSDDYEEIGKLELYISASLESIYAELEDFLKRRVNL